jgi:hypothetical protein
MPRGIPNFKEIHHAQQLHLCTNLSCFAQLRRDQHAPRAIHLHRLRMAYIQTLHPLLIHRHAQQLSAELLPSALRKHHQAAFVIARDHQLARAGRLQRFAMPRGHSHAAFGIQIQRRSTGVHGRLGVMRENGVKTLICTSQTIDSPPLCTFHHCISIQPVYKALNVKKLQ